MNYYNEFEPLKAEVLREAIKAGAIAPGDVDERSISDVRPADLAGYTQCHFFAGGGFWSLALRNAGWPDNQPCWTGSCPCPSFSSAGKGGGFDDPRHLWPDWARLIRECRPPVVFGEQADAAVGFGWVDLVQADLEAAAYAFGKVVFGAHSIGAPHIRQRLYFVADTESVDEQRLRECGARPRPRQLPSGGHVPVGNSSNPDGGQSSNRDLQRRGEHGLFAQDSGTGDITNAERDGGRTDLTRRRAEGRTADGRDCSTGVGLDAVRTGLQGLPGHVRDWRGPGWLDPHQARSIAETGATRGFWADCDWWYGRDGKYRPIGPSLQPLAHGSPSRVGRLRLYGDAIVTTQAAEFIEAYLEARGY